jgi:hypothetical protein
VKHLIVAAVVLVAVSAFAMIIVPSHAAASSIRGTVYWYDQYGNLHPLPWVQVIATGEGGVTTASSTTDGTYMMWVPAGIYNVTASSDPGFIAESHEIIVTPGGVAVVDFNLKPSGEPVPEYPPSLQHVMLVVAALAAIVLIRRRQRAMPMNSQSAPAS